MTDRSPDNFWSRTAARLVQLEQTIAVGLLIVVVVSLAAQVIARYVFGSPISWSEEVARLALIWLTFVASGFVTANHEHIRVDLFSSSLGPHANAWIDRVAGMLVLVTCLLLLVGGFRFVWRVWPVGSPSLGVSMSLWYAAASFGLALMALHTAVQLIAASPRKPDVSSEASASRELEESP